MSKVISNTPLRLALLGAGIFAHEAHLPALLRQRDRFELVAVYSRTDSSARALAQQVGHVVDLYTDWEDLLARNDIDAVNIVLPIPAQAPAVEAALLAGKHVISEKPIAPQSSAARPLIALHRRRSGQVWMVAENWRYEEAMVRAAERVAAGDIGRPLAAHWMQYVRMGPGNKYFATTWRREGAFPGGFLLDGGVHYVAALRLILGEVEEVAAMAAQNSPDLPPADTLTATLRFAGGALGSLTLCFAAETPWSTPLTIVGDAGSLRVERGSLEIVDAQGAQRSIECGSFNGVERELVAFADAIQLGRPHRNTPEEALRDVEIVEAMTASVVHPSR